MGSEALDYLKHWGDSLIVFQGFVCFLGNAVKVLGSSQPYASAAKYARRRAHDGRSAIPSSCLHHL